METIVCGLSVVVFVLSLTLMKAYRDIYRLSIIVKGITEVNISFQKALGSHGEVLDAHQKTFEAFSSNLETQQKTNESVLKTLDMTVEFIKNPYGRR